MTVRGRGRGHSHGHGGRFGGARGGVTDLLDAYAETPEDIAIFACGPDSMLAERLRLVRHPMSFWDKGFYLPVALIVLLTHCAPSPRYRTRPPHAPKDRPKGAATILKEDDEKARRRGARADAYQIGLSSYYGRKFHGRPTSSGERFDMYARTAAHRTLPFGTKIRVTNLENGKSVIVRVNDRGPFVEGRILDLSYAAARKIGMLETGTAMVKIEIVGGDGQ